MFTLLLVGCMKHDFGDNREITKERINQNVKNVFGTEFDPTHDWCTTTSGEIAITGIPEGIDKVQLLVYIAENDSATSMLILNEADVNGKSTITLSYDVPVNNIGMYVSFISNGSCVTKQVTANGVSYNTRAMTRAISAGYEVPSVTPAIQSTVESYASQRGWLPGQVLYEYNIQATSVNDYSDEYKNIFRTIIFSYFKNGRQYDNLPLIKESGYYNAAVYPITTGKDPIVVSPVYKSDKAKQYGNEIWNSDLYYYYFKESDLAGKNEADFLNSLPKYKVVDFSQHFGETEDDVISKRASYTLVYWGDGIPEIGTTGSYTFPEGYKIGFMVRAKTTADSKKKQGELYGDGRLNNNINNFGNFKSSNLGTDGPRMGWITVNEKMLLCCESGTDRDFNDIIIEVEGGVDPIINIPEFESNYYTFCFEDTELGDYDMNDLVIKARRIDDTTVEYKVVACGANDELKIMNINGQVINSNTEVHKLFGVNGGFINTVSGSYIEPVIDNIKVNKSFSFLDESTQPYLYDMTTGNIVKLAQKGEDPHAIMIPYDFRYPLEKICIKNAYSQFNSWGENKIVSTYWYKYPNEGYVY